MALVLSRAQALTCHTITNGSFTNVEVWDCGCVPASCDTLVILHVLSADEELPLGPAYVIIEESGSFTSSSRVVLAPDCLGLLILGSFDARRLDKHGSSQCINEGLMTLDTLFIYSGSVLNESELFASVASALPVTNLLNQGNLYAGLYACYGQLVNSGLATFEGNSFSQLLVNTGQLTALGSLYVQGSLDNEGMGMVTVADTLTLAQDATNYSSVSCGTLVVGDPMIGSPIVSLRSGSTTTCDNFLNRPAGTISGYSGSRLCIREHSENHGSIDGFLTICDLTPTGLTPPFLDLNTGTASTTLSYCQGGPCGPVSVGEASGRPGVRIFPQPAASSISLELGESISTARTIEIIDASGRMVRRMNGPFKQVEQMDCSGLESGVFRFIVRDADQYPIATMPLILVH